MFYLLISNMVRENEKMLQMVKTSVYMEKEKLIFYRNIKKNSFLLNITN